MFVDHGDASFLLVTNLTILNGLGSCYALKNLQAYPELLHPSL